MKAKFFVSIPKITSPPAAIVIRLVLRAPTHFFVRLIVRLLYVDITVTMQSPWDMGRKGLSL